GFRRPERGALLSGFYFVHFLTVCLEALARLIQGKGKPFPDERSADCGGSRARISSAVDDTA
ncbi:MAG TPA: hypothetical protein P5201_09105, partial [Aminobacteriaceae bacterium]|nr:hypothetical protein [Aminobacteriaceae bacterium]